MIWLENDSDNTNAHCEYCFAEFDLNNKNNQWELICIHCWKISLLTKYK
jgi:hypothetical protein